MIAGTHESVYEYDGESHRVRIKELESSVETKNETFVWCGSRICQKRSGSTVVRSYFKEGFEETGTTDYFYTRDHLGSVREVVASDGRRTASRTSYDPWGKATESGSGALSDFGFTGHHFDRPTGLSLTWFRGYDANLGRWLSKDPIGLDGGPNLYGYVDNDPMNFVDSTGRWPDDKCRASIEKQCRLACQSTCSVGAFMAACVPVCIFIESSMASPDNQLCVDTDNCEKKATNAMALCRATGGSVSRCAKVYDRVLASCLGRPIPPVDPSAH